MKLFNSFSQKYLVDEFTQRQIKNPSYSIRAFARDLNISKTTINDIMNGNRRLSASCIAKLKKVLNIDESTLSSLVNDRLNDTAPTRVVLSKEEFESIKDWYFLAILNLAKLAENEFSAQWVASRLALSVETAQSSLDHLLALKLIENRNGRIHRSARPMTTAADVPSESIREHHKQSLQKAMSCLSEVPVHLRDFTSVTYAITPSDIPNVKKMVTSFHRKLERTFSEKNAKEVYRLNIQFFPLTKVTE